VTSSEFWFPVGAAALYVYDSALLLWQNELVFTRTRARWLVHGGLALRLGGRRVFLPNPLLPQRAQFLVCWSKVGASAAPAGDLPAELFAALRPIAALNLLQVLLLLALPVAMWSTGAGIAALAVFALFYLASIAALILTWRRRARFRLSTKNFWLLALDGLACAPFAANLTRKLSTRHGLEGEPLRFAARHFDDAALASTRTLVEARVREEYADPAKVDHGEELLTALLPRLTR
jgi:hypothetical protein